MRHEPRKMSRHAVLHNCCITALQQVPRYYRYSPVLGSSTYWYRARCTSYLKNHLVLDGAKEEEVALKNCGILLRSVHCWLPARKRPVGHEVHPLEDGNALVSRALRCGNVHCARHKHVRSWGKRRQASCKTKDEIIVKLHHRAVSSLTILTVPIVTNSN